MTTDINRQAATLIDNQRYAEATALLEPAVTQNPNSSVLNYLLGVCQYAQQNYVGAEGRLSMAVSLNPRDPLAGAEHLAHYYLGLALDGQGRNGEAAAAYQRCVQLKPDYAPGLQKLGQQPPAPVAPTTATVVDATNVVDTSQPAVDRTLAHTIDKGSIADVLGPNRQMAGPLLYEGRRRARSFSWLISLTGVTLVAAVIGVLIVPVSIVLFGILFVLMSAFTMVSSITTTYSVYERRIDFQSGILSRKKRSLWLYEIEDVWLTRSPANLVTGDATVHFNTAEGRKGATLKGEFSMSGMGGAQKMREFFEEVRDAATVERRAMKNIWV